MVMAIGAAEVVAVVDELVAVVDAAAVVLAGGALGVDEPPQAASARTRPAVANNEPPVVMVERVMSVCLSAGVPCGVGSPQWFETTA